jgi:putative transposase
MPIRKIRFRQGGYYHLYNRGANRESIFLDDDDFTSFLVRLKQNSSRYSVQVIAYCLMPNHFHLLLRQESNVKAGIVVQHTCNGYSQLFNRRHEHQGTLFQGRFDGTEVDKDSYLRHLCRYIHANPVKDGFATKPELWPYSNYLEWIGKRTGTLVDRNFIIEHFGSGEAYIAYLADYLLNPADLPADLQTYLTNLEAN